MAINEGLHSPSGPQSPTAHTATGRGSRNAEQRVSRHPPFEVAAPASVKARTWTRTVAARLAVTDLVVVIAAIAVAQVVRFGFDPQRLVITGEHSVGLPPIDYTIVSVVLALSWFLSLSLAGTRSAHVVGTGATEYKLVVRATVVSFGSAAIVGFALQAQIGRSYLLIALPLGVTLLLLSRWLWRQWLVAKRRRGAMMNHAIVVGDLDSARHVVQQIHGLPGSGISIVGAAVQPGHDCGELAEGVRVLGDWNDLLHHVDESGADTVVITGSHPFKPRQLRELGWGLEERHVSLIVAPALTDVAGPRIHSTPVAGLPLIRVDYPELTGSRAVAKRAFDIVASAVGLIVSSPILLGIGIAVRLTSPGPALFRQERVGLNGATFSMLKFRTMARDAEQQLAPLLSANEAHGVLFKMRDDPRATRIGRVLRRHSFDELPQLWNVLKGDMSLVGPRPPLVSEVQAYERWVHRRLLVKPGITGLWQVSGRSDLSWEDSVRLDLYYVENWSLTSDLIILWRTTRAVLTKDGAY
ncbi:sugar transferase [Humibacter ginsenosidimutans]|uniref:Sugar transferase n=1 Tax=Humibacter ginsenosidimutans TaxID=2599293 RepID=A0A5B8M3W3_9MICO|nr:sugar transferase [Humibacter ginsenosidimutans]